MINDILTEGYFNPKTKRDSVSVEDTRTRAVNNFIRNLCNDIRTDNITFIQLSNNLDKYSNTCISNSLSDYSISPNINLSDLTDPIQFLFCCICKQFNYKFIKYNIDKFEICRKSDPDSVLFKIDDPDIINDLYYIHSYMHKVIPLMYYYIRIPQQAEGSPQQKTVILPGGSIQTKISYICANGSEVLNPVITHAIEDYMNSINSKSQACSINFNNYVQEPDNKKLYDIIQNKLDKEFEKHQGKPSLMNILKSVVTDNGSIPDMLKKSFAKLSDYISSQLPVRIDIIPTLEFDRYMINTISDILKKFPDIFLEGTAVSNTIESRKIL